MTALAAFFFLKLPTFNLSFFWDEIVVYAYPAQAIFEEGFLRMHPYFDRPATLFFGHPPAYASTIALFYKFLGASPWTARFFTFLLSFGGLVAIYRLMRLQYGAWAGFIAMVLLGSEPNYFVQSTQVLADVALMALIPVVLYFAAAGQFWAYAITAIYMVLVKETALALVVAVPLAKLLVHGRLSRREITAFSAPLAALALFFLNEKIFTGHISNWPPGQSNFLNELADYLPNLRAQFGAAIWNRPGGRFYIFLFLVASGALSALRGNPFKRNTGSWIFLAAIFSVIFFFLGKAFLTEVNEHYFIPVIPPLLIAATGIAWRIIPGAWLIFPMAALWFIVSVQVPDYHSSALMVGDPLEGKLNYIDVIKVQDVATGYVLKQYPGARVHAAWPVSSALSGGVAGFPENDFELLTGKNPGLIDILIWAEASSPPEYEIQKQLIQEQKLVLDKVFERNGRKISIFVRPGAGHGQVAPKAGYR